MSVLGNILWLLFGGILVAISYFIAGLVMCITIIGIPFGIALWRIALLSLFPFGRDVTLSSGRGGCLMIGLNVIWILLGWWEIALIHAVLGALLCITIIGIPFGMMHFKLAKFSLMPFAMSVN